MDKVKKFLKGLWGFVEVIIIIYVIGMTAFLLCKNDYGFTQLGDMTFITINEHLQENLPDETQEGDLLLVREGTDDIKVGDKIYYYATENNEYIIRTAHVREKVTSDENMALYQLDDEVGTTIATIRVIGKYSAVYHTIGGVLDILQSRIGFLLLVILPILLIFMYQIYALIIVIKYGEENVKDAQSDTHTKKEPSTKKEEEKKDKNEIELL